MPNHDSDRENRKGSLFQAALHDFVHDAAAGGAIRHLNDLSYSVDEIAAALSYPVSREEILQTIWKDYLGRSLILMDDPADQLPGQPTKIIREYTEYGKTTFRRVPDPDAVPVAEPSGFVPADFGRRIYRDADLFSADVEKALLKKRITSRDAVLLRELPWPLSTVWIRTDFFAGWDQV